MALGVFAGFTKALRSSTGIAMCFRMFYEGSTELYGWCWVFFEVLRRFYGALRVALCVFEVLRGLYGALRVDLVVFDGFATVLRSSTGGSMCFRRF